MMRRIVMNEHNFSVPLANNDSLQGMLWKNDDNPKAILLVVHGMTEHIERYETLANYLNEKRVQAGLSYDALASISNRPESTVKNLCLGKTEDPRLETVIPIMKAVGGSFDEMLFPEKNKDEIKEASLLALKDIYEYQLSVLKETNEEHIHNIRAHYEQHHEDLKENFEKRLADKRDLIESYKEHNQTLKKEFLISKIALCICVVVFITVLIAELMNPNLGWLRF